MQLVLTPAPALIHGRARRLLKRRERSLNQGDRRDPLDSGTDSVVEAKELKGALETQHRSLCYFDLRVAGDDPVEVRRLAGMFGQLRSENELVRRDVRLRRALYAPYGSSWRCLTRCPACTPGSCLTSELATLWQLPRARAKLSRIPRSPLRRAVAPPEICRDPARGLLVDEHGPVGIARRPQVRSRTDGRPREREDLGHGPRGGDRRPRRHPSDRSRRRQRGAGETGARADPRRTAPSTTSTSAARRSGSTRSPSTPAQAPAPASFSGPLSRPTRPARSKPAATTCCAKP